MSRLFCLDCNVLIWGVRQQATPGQEHMVERAEAFLSNCTAEKAEIIIPSVVLAEFLVRVDVHDMPAVEKSLASRFQIGSFDVRAARQFAQLHRAYRASNNGPAGADGTKMKKDFMVVATALAYGASVIITEDLQLARFAQGRIPVSNLPSSGRQVQMDLRQEPRVEG